MLRTSWLMAKGNGRIRVWERLFGRGRQTPTSSTSSTGSLTGTLEGRRLRVKPRPSYGALASFLSTGIKQDGQLLGVFCTQLPPESRPVEVSEMELLLDKAEKSIYAAANYYLQGRAGAVSSLVRPWRRWRGVQHAIGCTFVGVHDGKVLPGAIVASWSTLGYIGKAFRWISEV